MTNACLKAEHDPCPLRSVGRVCRSSAYVLPIEAAHNWLCCRSLRCCDKFDKKLAGRSVRCTSSAQGGLGSCSIKRRASAYEQGRAETPDGRSSRCPAYECARLSHGIVSLWARKYLFLCLDSCRDLGFFLVNRTEGGRCKAHWQSSAKGFLLKTAAKPTS